jgi:hypothetical protein
VIALLKTTRQLLADVLWFAIATLRPTPVVAAENLFSAPAARGPHMALGPGFPDPPATPAPRPLEGREAGATWDFRKDKAGQP